MKYLVVFLLVSLVSACSPPKNWTTMTPKERLLLADVVVKGRVRNLVKTTHGYSFTYHVDCVLKNSINVSIGASLSISNPHASYMCVDDYPYLTRPGDSILQLERAVEGSDDLKPHDVNLERAIYTTSEVSLTQAQTWLGGKGYTPTGSTGSC